MTTYKVSFDDSAWSGDPSNWKTPEAYCAACLIDENTGDTKTKDKCALPYKKPGSSAVNRNALRTMATGRGLPAVKASAAAKKKAAQWIIRMWPQAFDKPAPENIYAIAGQKRPTGSKSVFYKDANEQYWFFGIFSNNFEDREGEIISWDAHLDNARWLREKNIRPPVTVLHSPHFPPLFHILHTLAVLGGDITPQQYSTNLKELYASTAIAETHAVIPLNNFIFVVAKVYDNKKSLVERLAQVTDSWGMSHGFVRTKSDGNITTKYRSFEYSVLPNVLAANAVTPFGIIKKGELVMDDVVKQLSEEDRTLLNDLLSGGVEDLESATEKARDILQRVLGSKSLEVEKTLAEEETPAEEQEVSKSYAEIRDQLMADLKIDELVGVLKAAGDTVRELQEEIAQLKAKIVALETDEDTKIASQFAAPDWTLGFGKKQREDAEDDPELLEELKKQAPEEIVKSLNAETDNPLVKGFWQQISRGS